MASSGGGAGKRKAAQGDDGLQAKKQPPIGDSHEPQATLCGSDSSETNCEPLTLPEMPNDILFMILSDLELADRVRFRGVCKRMQAVERAAGRAASSQKWKQLEIKFVNKTEVSVKLRNDTPVRTKEWGRVPSSSLAATFWSFLACVEVDSVTAKVNTKDPHVAAFLAVLPLIPCREASITHTHPTIDEHRQRYHWRLALGAISSDFLECTPFSPGAQKLTLERICFERAAILPFYEKIKASSSLRTVEIKWGTSIKNRRDMAAFARALTGVDPRFFNNKILKSRVRTNRADKEVLYSMINYSVFMEDAPWTVEVRRGVGDPTIIITREPVFIDEWIKIPYEADPQ